MSADLRLLQWSAEVGVYVLRKGHVVSECGDRGHLYVKDVKSGLFVCTDCGRTLKYDEFMKGWKAVEGNK